jgi:hypothetical protein
VLELALQTMAGILSNFFDVSFYAFTHNYSLFLLFSFVTGTILSSVITLQILSKIHDETQKNLTIKRSNTILNNRKT